MLVICPQCEYLYLPSNIRICPQLSVFAPEFNFRYMCSGFKDYISKYKERWCIKTCIKSYFNQINTFQNIEITWNETIRSNVYVALKKNFHSNVNVLGRFYKYFLTSLYRLTLFDIFFKPVSKQKYLQVEQRQRS